MSRIREYIGYRTWELSHEQFRILVMMEQFAVSDTLFIAPKDEILKHGRLLPCDLTDAVFNLNREAGYDLIISETRTEVILNMAAQP